MEDAKRKRVLCPVEGKDGKTFWRPMGIAYVNNDNSINLYLDGLPLNGKLQVRDWDNPPWEKRDAEKPALRAVAGGLSQQDELPF